jgi:hypothetical protein
MGSKDIGYGCTVQIKTQKTCCCGYTNYPRELGMEFAVRHFLLSYYFHKDDNAITNLG